MNLTADLHIHSHFSRATSKDLDFEHLALWAQRKGVQVVGTGDIAHPGWLQEMRDKLEPAEEGLLRLKDDLANAVARDVFPACQGTVRFMLAGEISSIYKKKGRTRKVHNVIFAPNLEAVEGIQAALERIGNIRSDGRPILGLPSRDLLEIILEVDERCHLIPAHIWTPWFSLLGSKSGYDSVAECFDDLTPHIFAVETGLSSDPPMNWRVAALDRYTLVSNSDAHSPPKLAREATLFDTELSYDAIFEALQSGDPASFLGTIEFFPEEGKYHHDGHRKCGVNWKPSTTLAHGGLCPVCGKPVTVGVGHRVEMLADRPEGECRPNAHPFHSLIPLPEILAELLEVGAGSKRVQAEYERLLSQLGPELTILRLLPLEEIAAAGGARLAEGIGRMRRGQVNAIAGYDGEYGVIKLFDGAVAANASPQLSLFGDGAAMEGEETREESDGQQQADRPTQALAEPAPAAEPEPAKEGPSPLGPLSPAQVTGVGEGWQSPTVDEAPLPLLPAHHLLDPLNDQQRQAVLSTDRPLIVVAGPGTGKTRTLTVRIAYLVQAHRVPPERILAITFTNKAAAEMAERLQGLLGPALAGRIAISTFHAFGAALLRQHGRSLGIDPNFAICGDEERAMLVRQAWPGLSAQQVDRALALISAAKNRLQGPEQAAGDGAEDLEAWPAVYDRYEAARRGSGALDLDDLITQSVRLLEDCPDVLRAVQGRFGWISVDEYQDINLAQHRLLRLLTDGGANLCVIGDPDQAIYGFRGADYRYFERFEQDFPGARRLHLTRNYRSTQMILDAATQVIARNPDRNALTVFSQFVDEVKLDVYRAPTDRAEAETVVHRIEQLVGGTSYFSLDSGRVAGDDTAAQRSFADFAVLYRLRALSVPLVEAFERSGIPFQTVGQTPLVAHKDVRELLAYLWLLARPSSRLHLQVVLGAGKPAFSAQEVDRLWEMAFTGSAPGDDAGRAGVSSARLGHGAAAMGGLSKAQRGRLAELAALWAAWEAPSTPHPVAWLVEQAYRFLAQQRSSATGDRELARLAQLERRAAAFGSDLSAFLEATALQGETDAYDPRADRVTLMTLHAAKGLEFPVVFMVGCEEGLLPYVRSDEQPDVEEERRLFYVGMTRARQKLMLSHARRRFLFGQAMENRPSRFVDDIDSALKALQETARRRAEKQQPAGTQLSLF